MPPKDDVRIRALGCFKKEEETLRYSPGAFILGALPVAGAETEIWDVLERMVVSCPFELTGGFDFGSAGDLREPPKLIFEK